MNRGGFTLLEVVVSLSISTVIALLLHRGVSEFVSLGERGAARRQAAAESAAVRRQIAGWLRGVFVHIESPEVRFEGEDGGASAAGGDRLRFRTTAAYPAGHGSLWMELRIVRGQDAGLVAWIEDVQATPAGQAAGSRREVLLVPGASGLQARYLLDLGDEMRWVNGWSSSARLPRAVELRILGDSVPDLLRVPILVALSGG